MGKMEQALRAEIGRLARKEIRAALKPLTKDVRQLKRDVARLAKGQPAAAGGAKAKKAPSPIELTATPEEVAKARFSPGLIKKLRKRLNITQAELATIIDVSPTTVAFWEQGRNRPTEDSQVSLVALRKLGRRDVKRILDAKG
jgi:DNA-binding transcriptional regulator YiaG